MRALGPREVVADLVVIGFVDPRLPGRSVLRSSAAGEIDRGNPVVHVRAAEQAVKREARWSRDQTDRADVDAIAVVVKRRFVEERRADHISGVNDGAIGGIAESVADSRDIVAAPLRSAVALADLLRNPVPEDRELAIDGMVNAHDLFFQVRWDIVAADEVSARGRSR